MSNLLFLSFLNWFQTNVHKEYSYRKTFPAQRLLRMESREELEATLEKIPKGKAEVELKIVAKYKLFKKYIKIISYCHRPQWKLLPSTNV